VSEEIQGPPLAPPAIDLAVEAEEAEAVADAEEAGNPFGMTLRDEDPDHPEPELIMVCPICGLPACFHNLPYIQQTGYPTSRRPE
jgi:hypothetical protein